MDPRARAAPLGRGSEQSRPCAMAPRRARERDGKARRGRHRLSRGAQGMDPRARAAPVVFLTIADLVLATIPLMMFGVVFWGLHMGFTQGLLATLVADTAPVELRGTAFGMFNLMTGTVLLIASILAGWLWDAFGPTASFLTGAVFSGFAALLMAIYLRARQSYAEFHSPSPDGRR